jgi:uncharacterized DUF497 family protein
MKKYCWHEKKRISNLKKHHLDFKDADMVLENSLRLEVDSDRNGEKRKQAFAYVFEVLSVLTVAYIPDFSDCYRVISFRRANSAEREVYYEWLENDNDDQ